MILAALDILLLFFFSNFPKISYGCRSPNLEVTQKNTLSEFWLNIIKYLIFFRKEIIRTPTTKP